MMNTFKLLFVFSVALLAITRSGSVFADSPSTDIETVAKINSANQLVRDGHIEQAIGAYAEVDPNHGHGNNLDYNLAVAHYRNGDIDAAESLFAKVANSSGETVASNSRYNLGNCNYARALKVAEQDKPLAIEHLNKAISHYRGSLRDRPNHTDARANIELAAQLIRELQQLEEQEHQQQDDQQNGEQQDGEQQDGQQQDGQQQDGEQLDGQQQDGQQQDGEQLDGQQQDGEQQDGQQQDGQQQEGQQQDGQQQGGQQHPPSDSGQSSEQDRGTQSDSTDKATDNTSSGTERQAQANTHSGRQEEREHPTSENETEADDQPVPKGELTAAGAQDDNEKPTGTVAAVGPDMKDGLMTKEEAMKMLQAVRDRDMLRRLQQQQRERSRHVAVDRDW